MEKLRRVALLSAVVSLVAAGTANAVATYRSSHESTQDVGAEQEQSERAGVTVRGVARRGDVNYSRMFASWPRDLLAERIAYHVQFPSIDSQLASQKASPGEAFVMFGNEFGVSSDPNYPVGPSILGETTTTTSCGMVSSGGGFQWADIEYKYEYRYTRDSNGDGRNDSDLKWVLVGASWEYWQPNTSQICQ